MAIVVSATWTVKPGEENTVLEALRHLAPASRKEPGNVYYQAYRDPGKPRVFHFFEIYTDLDAVAAHVQYPHFVTWATGHAIPALEDRQRQIYHTLDV